MKRFVFTATVVLCLVLATSAFALDYCRNQTVYVPALCNDFGTGINSYTRLIIHNVDPDNVITVQVYFLSPSQGPDDGAVYSSEPEELAPWASKTVFVNTSTAGDPDFRCGTAYAADVRPKFIVEWFSTKWVVPPSIRGAAGITGLMQIDSDGTSHSETLSEGIVIDGRCR